MPGETSVADAGVDRRGRLGEITAKRLIAGQEVVDHHVGSGIPLGSYATPLEADEYYA